MKYVFREWSAAASGWDIWFGGLAVGIRVRRILLRYQAFLLETDFFFLGGNDRIIVVCYEVTVCEGR